MTDRIRTLVLYSNGAGWKSIAADTLIRGILGSRIDEKTLLRSFRRIPPVRKLFAERYRHMSYVFDWQEAFQQHPALEPHLCNINDFVSFSRLRGAIREYPLIVILHSATGDSVELLLKTASWFQSRKGKLAVFIGNEYDLMEKKFRFLRKTQADYVCSQLPADSARWLYGELPGTTVLPLPHGLNPNLYENLNGNSPRAIDIGFRGDLYPFFIGDTERSDFIRLLGQKGGEYDLRCDIQFRRVDRAEWAKFLCGCKGVVGGESGSYYLDRRGEILARAKAYLARHPDTTFEAMYDACFRDLPEHVNGKCISSRHFEPVGTRTCQVLMEGEYNGILQSDEHYIAVRKDLSNLDEAIARFRDESLRQKIVQSAWEHVVNNHTYHHRIDTFLEALAL